MNKKLLVLTALLISLPVSAQQLVQPQVIPAKAPVVNNINNPQKNKTIDPKNIVGTVFAENSIKKIDYDIKTNNFSSAKKNADSISEWISDAAEYHTDLFKTLKRIQNADAQANIERDLAIKFAMMRDKLTFLEAQILIHDGQFREAVDKLVQVIKSQPDSDLGFKAYKKLQEIGFSFGVELLPVKTEPIQAPVQ
jgi:hypothetical protein